MIIQSNMTKLTRRSSQIMMIMLDNDSNDDDPKAILANLPDDPASSPHLCVVCRCSDWNRLFKSSPSKKKKKTLSFFFVCCRLGWNILSSSSPSKSSWLKTLSISSLSIMSGSSLLEYNSLNLHPCRCHYDYQFQVLILIIVHA